MGGFSISFLLINRKSHGPCKFSTSIFVVGHPKDGVWSVVWRSVAYRGHGAVGRCPALPCRTVWWWQQRVRDVSESVTRQVHTTAPPPAAAPWLRTHTYPRPSSRAWPAPRWLKALKARTDIRARTASDPGV